jgi:ribosomal protein L40E
MSYRDGTTAMQTSFSINNRKVGMSNSETSEPRGFQICERCGNTYAVDADGCSRCGAKGRAVSSAEKSRHSSDFFRSTRHPGRLPRTTESEAYPSIREEAPHRFVNQPRPNRITLYSIAILVVIGSLIAVLAYSRAVRQPVPESVSEHSDGPGSVASVPSSTDTSGASIATSQPSSSSLISSIAVDKSTADATPPKAVDVKPTQDAAAERANGIVASARYALKKADLAAVRERLRTLPAGLQTEPEVRLLWGALVRRERERDVTLQDARWCEEGKDWSCMARYAAHVQALDTGNAESHVMLERAIDEIGRGRSAQSRALNVPAQVVTRPSGDSQ